MLLNYHIGRLVLSSLCVGALVRLVLGRVRFAGCSLQSLHCFTIPTFSKRCTCIRGTKRMRTQAFLLDGESCDTSGSQCGGVTVSPWQWF